MADPYVFGGAAFFYEGMTFPSQPFGGLDDGLLDNNMSYIDPSLQSPSPTPYGNTWAAPPQPPLKDTSKAAFLAGDLPRQALNHTPIRPTLGIPPVPSSSHARFASPVSSIQPPSAGSALSPPADTESYYDNFPRTPPDTALLSPFQAPLPLDPFSNAHAVQFASMGPGYVSPRDVNTSQQSEYCESDNDIIDFNFAQPGCSFDGHAGHAGHRDIEPVQGAVGSGFVVQQAGSRQMRSMVKEEIEVSSQYPPPKDEDVGSDDEILVKRMVEDDDADGDYRPNKRPRQKANARAPPRRNTKPTTGSPSRPRRNRATNSTSASLALPPPTASTSRDPLTCPNCQEPNFPSQPDLDAHIQRHHHRPFNCVFDFAGCNTTFAKKNEWKRHVSTQHLLLNYWLCTEGVCADARPEAATTTTTTATPPPAGAIFNRKDLFTQHLKRMHTPKQVKDLLRLANTTSTTNPTGKKSTAKSSSAGGMKPPASPAVAAWNARIGHLQATAIHPRCHLPTLMRCPVPGCAAPPFRGPDAWDQRMEHVAKHMERHATSSSSQAGKERAGRVVFGGEGDDTLVDWASRPEVGIIEPREGVEGGWVLRGLLKRGPGGNVVVTAPVQQQQQQQQVRRGRGGRGGEVVEEGVEGEVEEEEEEEDAEGEEDD